MFSIFIMTEAPIKKNENKTIPDHKILNTYLSKSNTPAKTQLKNIQPSQKINT